MNKLRISALLGIALSLAMASIATTATAADCQQECKKNKVFVCHVKPNGKSKTQCLPKATADKRVESSDPDSGSQYWLCGRCEDVISPG